MDITGVDIYNTGVRFENIGLGIKNPVVQETSHKEKNNKYEDDDNIKLADKDTPEEDVHHLHLKPPTERQICNLRPRKPRNQPGVDDYAHAQMVHYKMTQYPLIKGPKKINNVGEEEVEN